MSFFQDGIKWKTILKRLQENIDVNWITYKRNRSPKNLNSVPAYAVLYYSEAEDYPPLPPHNKSK